MDSKSSRPRLIKVRSTVCHDYTDSTTTGPLSQGATIPAAASRPPYNSDGSGTPITLVSLAGKKSSWQESSRRHTGIHKLTKTNPVIDLDENDHVVSSAGQSTSNSVMSDFECELDGHSAGLEENKDMGQVPPSQLQDEEGMESKSISPSVDDIELSIDQEIQEQMSEEEVSFILDWFRKKFTSIGKHGRVTLKDFRHAARESEVRVTVLLLSMCLRKLCFISYKKG